MTSRYSTDIVIFGGGIAGLWLLNRLKQRGYDCVLLETDRLGQGQTLASQGIIHGGLKYALGGKLSGASQVIAEMPARWRQLLAGKAELDLQDVRVLSDHYYMWSGADMRSKLKSFLGSKSLRGRVERVDRDDYPEFFQQASTHGRLYRLPDFVIDSASLVRSLYQRTAERIFSINPGAIEFGRNEAAGIVSCRVQGDLGELDIKASRFVFAAGAGNEALLEASGCSFTRAQKRPLNMVYLTHSSLPEIFVHCIGSDFSLTPRLTVTSHRSEDQSVTWYLGGELAESGVGLIDEEQIERAECELQQLFPWLDISNAKWQCLHIDRAEASTESNARPDDAYFREEKNTLVVWPTKFTLVPALADRVLAHLDVQPISRTEKQDLSPLQSVLAPAEPGNCPWNQ